MSLSVRTALPEPARVAGERVDDLLRKHTNVPVLLLLSGGSAFDVLPYISHEVLGANVSITMLDDRFSTYAEANNFVQMTEHSFMDVCMETGCYLFGTQVNVQEPLSEYSQRYVAFLERWLRENENGRVVAIMGVGTDGHTAGIMPFPEQEAVFYHLFEQPDDIATAYDTGNKSKYPIRVTVTNNFLRTYVDHAVMYAVGATKQDALERVVAPDGAVHETPARIIHDMPDVMLFTDLKLST